MVCPQQRRSAPRQLSGCPARQSVPHRTSPSSTKRCKPGTCQRALVRPQFARSPVSMSILNCVVRIVATTTAPDRSSRVHVSPRLGSAYTSTSSSQTMHSRSSATGHEVTFFRCPAPPIGRNNLRSPTSAMARFEPATSTSQCPRILSTGQRELRRDGQDHGPRIPSREGSPANL